MSGSPAAPPPPDADALRARLGALEAALRDAESRSRLLFEGNPNPMWVYDLDTLAFLAVNDAGVRTYGYSRDEFLAMTIKDVRPPEDVPALLRDIERTLPTGFHEAGVWRHRRKDGTVISVEVSSHGLSFAGRSARLVLARDVTERQRAEDALRKRAAEADSLAEVGRALSASLDLQTVLDLIAERACLLLGSERSAIAVVEEEEPGGGVIRFVARRGLSPQFAEPLRPLHWRDGTAAMAIHERRPVWTADILDDPALDLTPSTRAVVEAEGYRAVLSVPLLAGQRALGAIAVFRDAPGPFSREEIDLLQAFAAQAVVALDNARLYAEAERRRREAEVLADLARTINASLDLDTVLERVVQGARELCRSDGAVIALRDPAGETMVFRRLSGARSESTTEQRVEPGKGAGGRVLMTGAPFRTDHYADDPRITKDYVPAALDEGIVTLMVVPIRGPDRIEGLLYVTTRVHRPFSDRDEAILGRLADHVAIAVANARLFAETERRRRAAESLASVGRRISQSLDPLDVGRRIAESVCRLLGVRASGLYRLPRGGDTLELFAESAESPDEWAEQRYEWQQRLSLGVAAAGYAAQQRRPVATPDILDEPRIRLAPGARERIGESRFRSRLAVPLLIQDAVVGALVVADLKGRVFGDEEIHLAQAFADQAALALENARLYEEVQTQLRQLEATQAQLLQAAKLAAVGQLIGGVAHELNNPLSVVFGHAQLLERQSRDPRILDRARKILASASRAARIVRELQNFARPRPAALVPVNLAQVVERVLGLREHTLRVSGITVHREIASAVPPVLGDVAQLEQVLLHLILNAEQAMVAGGGQRLEVRLAAADGRVRLVVADRGPGIRPEILPRIFEPFFTTKPVGQGTGLGLSISYGIVQAHGGRIWAESVPGQGATLTVELPAHATPDGDADAGPPPAAQAPGRGQILVIDDEADVAEALADLLRDLGQEVTVATSGEAAWRHLSRPRARWDLVTLDLKMPDISGQALWERLVAERREVADRVVFITGDTVEPDTQRFLDRAGRPVLGKPFHHAALAALLAAHVPPPPAPPPPD